MNLKPRVKKHNIALLSSGVGTNVFNLIHACEHPIHPCRVVLSVGYGDTESGSFRHMAFEQYRFDESKDFFDLDDDLSLEQKEDILMARCSKLDVRFICLCGFMDILSEDFVDEWEGRIFNIHPSLLPKYKGLHTHKRVLQAGDKEHGCSVHFVDKGIDTGPVIMQSKTEVRDGDTVESLRKRVLRLEHELYPVALIRAIRDYEIVNYFETDIIGDMDYYRNEFNKHRLHIWDKLYPIGNG